MNRKILSGLVLACVLAPMAVMAADTREVVSFKKIKETLPEKLGDYVRTATSGQTATVGEMTTSTAQAKYAKDKDGNEPTFEITVMDYNNPQMVAGMAYWTKMNIATETDDEYTKTTKIDGNAAMVHYNTKNKSGTYTLLVADRFLVTVSTNGMKEDDFKKVPDLLPLKKIAELAK